MPLAGDRDTWRAGCGLVGRARGHGSAGVTSGRPRAVPEPTSCTSSSPQALRRADVFPHGWPSAAWPANPDRARMILQLLPYLALGALAGWLAGLLGIGGGLVVVAALVWLLPAQGVPAAALMQVALATALASIVFTAFQRVAPWRGALAAGGWLAPGLVLGSAVGAVLATWLPSRLLAVFVAVYCLLSAWQLAWGRTRAASQSAVRWAGHCLRGRCRHRRGVGHCRDRRRLDNCRCWSGGAWRRCRRWQPPLPAAYCSGLGGCLWPVGTGTAVGDARFHDRLCSGPGHWRSPRPAC